MDVPYDDQIEEGKKALLDPQPGDHWTERFSCHLFVIGRLDDKVLVLERFQGRNVPDDGEPVVYTLEGFKKHLSYADQSTETWMRLIERGIDVRRWVTYVACKLLGDREHERSAGAGRETVLQP